MMKPDRVIKTRRHKVFHGVLMRLGVKDGTEQRDVRNHGERGLMHPFVIGEWPHDAQPRLPHGWLCLRAILGDPLSLDLIQIDQVRVARSRRRTPKP